MCYFTRFHNEMKWRQRTQDLKSPLGHYTPESLPLPLDPSTSIVTNCYWAHQVTLSTSDVPSLLSWGASLRAGPGLCHLLCLAGAGNWFTHSGHRDVAFSPGQSEWFQVSCHFTPNDGFLSGEKWSWPFSISRGKQALSWRKCDGGKGIQMTAAGTALAAVTGSRHSPKELVWAEHVSSLK